MLLSNCRLNHQFSDKSIKFHYDRSKNSKQGVNTVNLKEAFRFQNKLAVWMDEAPRATLLLFVDGLGRLQTEVGLDVPDGQSPLLAKMENIGSGGGNVDYREGLVSRSNHVQCRFPGWKYFRILKAL